MNGALHDHSTSSTDSSVASFRRRRCNAFITGSSSTDLQEQGARRASGPDNPRPAPLRASTRLAIAATGLAPSDAEIVPLQLLLQPEARQPQDLGRLGLVV